MASLDPTEPDGPEVIVVSGGIVSTRQAYVVGSPVFPALSVARTENVCGPCGKPSYDLGDEHGA